MEKIRRAVAEIMDDVAVFHFLNKEEMETLLPYLELKVYAQGETLFREGDPGDFVCFICSGKVEIKKETQFKGKHVIIAVFSKGSFVGELSIIDGKPRSATVVALEDSQTLVFTRGKFESLVRDHPQIGVKLLQGIARVLSLRLRKAGDRLAAIF